MGKGAIFDADGTLIDSAPGILRSVQYSLEKMGRPVPEESALTCFIGPPLIPAFMTPTRNMCWLTSPTKAI